MENDWYNRNPEDVLQYEQIIFGARYRGIQDSHVRYRRQASCARNTQLERTYEAEKKLEVIRVHVPQEIH